MNATRHVLDHGWNTPDGYLCDGCAVRGVHQHRCHEADAGPQCECELCHPTREEIEAFRRELGMPAPEPLVVCGCGMERHGASQSCSCAAAPASGSMHRPQEANDA